MNTAAALHPSTRHRQLPTWQILAVLALTMAFASAARAVGDPNDCGNPFVNHFGPWDYRLAPPSALRNVESNHFTPPVEALIRGEKTGPNIAQDVAYTLHVFPNHHRALLTMSRLADKFKSETPAGARRTVDCYFQRAVRFSPDDPVVRMLYAQYLGKRDRRSEALSHLAYAQQVGAENPLTQYNLGLVYFEIGEFQLARAQAARAREMGLERDDLERMLQQAGK